MYRLHPLLRAAQDTHTYGPPRARIPPRRGDLPLTRAEAHRMVAAVFAAIGDAIAKDEPVSIAGFGRFNNRDCQPLRGRNPRTGETIAIPASRAPEFRTGRLCAMPTTSHGSEIPIVHPHPAHGGGSLTAGPQCRPTGPVPPTTRAAALALNRPCLRISGRAGRDERQARPRSNWCVIQVGQ